MHGHNCVRSVIVEEKRATRQLLSNRVRHCYFSDFIGLPCATFYKAKSHHATKETADRLLEKIASRNVSDIGESDDEDDIPQEDFPRENCETQSSNKGKDGGDRSPLKKIRVEDNVPKNFQWKKKVYHPHQTSTSAVTTSAHRRRMKLVRHTRTFKGTCPSPFSE